ncbi:NFYA1 [Hepatospora eriocheir]|uniref:Transcriptional activator HAP2 n=1 Tax=Hepatospora eriocheir TaxID=1081669 RepID=A0A1X0QDZ6_9MICR|nr:NFYA1 [Hepatospora eriocheir]
MSIEDFIIKEDYTKREEEAKHTTNLTEDFIKELLNNKNKFTFQNDPTYNINEPLYNNTSFNSSTASLSSLNQQVDTNNFTKSKEDKIRNIIYNAEEDDLNSIYKYLNPKQVKYIRLRKARREFLNKLTEYKNKTYLHESRHKHAVSRLRASTGRFMTKEEMREHLENKKK